MRTEKLRQPGREAARGSVTASEGTPMPRPDTLVRSSGASRLLPLSFLERHSCAFRQEPRSAVAPSSAKEGSRTRSSRRAVDPLRLALATGPQARHSSGWFSLGESCSVTRGPGLQHGTADGAQPARRNGEALATAGGRKRVLPLLGSSRAGVCLCPRTRALYRFKREQELRKPRTHARGECSKNRSPLDTGARPGRDRNTTGATYAGPPLSS